MLELTTLTTLVVFGPRLSADTHSLTVLGRGTGMYQNNIT